MPVTFEKHTLPNGLTVIAEVDPDAHSAAAGFFVRTGARDERPEVMGVSHFLEHMMFKGTARRSADDVNREFDAIGARHNAYTTSEMTCFHAQVLPEALPEAIDILSDILRPALRGEDFNTEKQVILEEIAMYQDEPFWVLYEEVVARRYAPHPLAHRVLGTSDTITALRVEQMREYFDNRYSADNTVVALAGRLDFRAAVEQIAGACKHWERTNAKREPRRPAPHDEMFTLTRDNVTRCYQMLLTEAPAMDDERRYAAMLLSQALGAGDNSRLHWALVETGMADEASASYDPHDGVGEHVIVIVCDPERADEVWGVVEREIANLRDSLSDDDLERLRSKVATAVTLAGERPDGRMQRIGRVWTYLRSRRSLEEELAAIERVTLDDLRAVFDAFPFTPRTIGRLMPA